MQRPLLYAGVAGLLASARAALSDFELDPHHVSNLKTSRSPNIFTVPELQVPHRGWRALRKLSADGGDGEAVHLGHRVEHSFVGTTDVGFVDYRVDSLTKHSLVQLGDYADALEGARWECRPLNEGEWTSVPENGKLPERVPVRVTLTPPPPPQPEQGMQHNGDGYGHADALQHLYDRLVPSEKQEGDFLIDFDHAFLDSSAGFPYGSDCSHLIPAMAPLFKIKQASLGASTSTIELVLLPAAPQDAFQAIDLEMRWTPDAEEELKRRSEAGLDLGQDVRGRRRQLFADLTKSFGYSVNYNLDTMSIENRKIPLVANDVLNCDNCFAYFKATFVLKFKFCLGYNIGIGVRGWFASEMLTNAAGINAISEGGYGGDSIAGGEKNLADCFALTVDKRWALTTPNFLGVGGGYLRDYAFDVAMLFEAYLEGSSAFGFGLSTKGVSQAGVIGTCSNLTDSSYCVPVTTNFKVPPNVAMALTGVSAEFDLTVGVGAVFSGEVRVDASFSVRAAAGSTSSPFKFGGKLQLDSLRALQGSVNGYTTLPLSFSAKPLTYKLLAPVRGTLDATLFVTVGCKLFGGVIPLKTTAKFRTVTRIVPGASTARRQLRLGSSVSPWGMEGYRQRLLQSAPDTLATCSTSSGFITVDASAGAGAGVDAITVGSTLSAFKVPGVVLDLLPNSLVSTEITPAKSLGGGPLGSPTAIMNACVKVNNPVQGYVRPGMSAITSSGGGSTFAGSEAAPTDEIDVAAATTTTAKSGVSLGLIIGAAAGAAVLLIGIAAVAVWASRRGQKKPAKAAAGNVGMVGSGGGNANGMVPMQYNPALPRPGPGPGGMVVGGQPMQTMVIATTAYQPQPQQQPGVFVFTNPSVNAYNPARV